MMKKQLDEINIIRPIIIFILVVRHAFTMYTGAWSLPVGIENIPSYFWVHRLAFNPMLEMFVFVSGYLLAYQIFEQKKVFTLQDIVRSKFKRLIIPSLVFSLCYALLFENNNIFTFRFVYDVLCGMGHLWFLPMIFWVILITHFLYKSPLKEEIKLLILFCLSVGAIIPLPLRLDRALYFLFFFYFASYVWNRKNYISDKFANIRFVLIGFVVFNCIVIITTMLQQQLDGCFINNIFVKAICLSTGNLLRFIQAVCGVLWLYVTVLYFLKIGKIVPDWLVNVNKLCMGIFIFQQFILNYLYYISPLPGWFGSYWLPWVSVVLALFGSLLLTYLFRKTSVGRLLV